MWFCLAPVRKHTDLARAKRATNKQLTNNIHNSYSEMKLIAQRTFWTLQLKVYCNNVKNMNISVTSDFCSVADKTQPTTRETWWPPPCGQVDREIFLKMHISDQDLVGSCSVVKRCMSKGHGCNASVRHGYTVDSYSEEEKMCCYHPVVKLRPKLIAYVQCGWAASKNETPNLGDISLIVNMTHRHPVETGTTTILYEDDLTVILPHL